MTWSTRTAKQAKGHRAPTQIQGYESPSFWDSYGHIALVAPKKYFEPYPLGKMELPPKIPGDQDDIPQNSGNRRTTANYQMDLNQQKGTLRAYYASVSFVDALVGKILTALEATSKTTPSSSSPATTDTTWANTTFGRR